MDPEWAHRACYWVGERHQILGCQIEEQQGRWCWVRDPELFRRKWLSSDSHSIADSDHQDRAWWFHYEMLDREPREAPRLDECLRDVEFYRPCLIIRSWKVCGSAPSNSPGNSTNEIHTEIWFVVHHAFCDGGGGIAIANDWIQIYENLIAGEEPTKGLPPIDSRRFAKRNHLGLLRWKFLRVLPLQPVGLLGAIKFIFRKTAQLSTALSSGQTSSSTETPEPQPNPVARFAFVAAWMDADRVQWLERDAEDHGFNLNARFLGEMFGSLQRWYLKREPSGSPKDWIRIILPISLRDIGDRRLPAANRSSLVQVDRRNLKNPVPQSLFQSIEREIQIIMSCQLDRMFLIFIRVIGLSDRLLKHVSQNRKHRGLAVFTNLGQPFRRLERRHRDNTFGGATKGQALARFRPVEIDFLAPLRHGTPLNFSIAKFEGRMRVTIHFDPDVVDREEATALLDDYIRAVSHVPEAHARS